MGPSSGHQLLQSDNIGLFGFDAPWAQEVLLSHPFCIFGRVSYCEFERNTGSKQRKPGVNIWHAKTVFQTHGL